MANIKGNVDQRNVNDIVKPLVEKLNKARNVDPNIGKKGNPFKTTDKLEC